MRYAAVTLLAVVLAGCALKGSAVDTESPSTSHNEWPSLMAQASQEAGAGRYGVADKLLSDFTTRYPASSEAAESMFWRAVYKLDPSNPNASTREAVVLLDGYLNNATAPRRTEASSLRRVAMALEAKPTTVTVQSSARPAASDQGADKARDDEIARLKDELSKANAELDRIKKRLAQPTKP